MSQNVSSSIKGITAEGNISNVGNVTQIGHQTIINQKSEFLELDLQFFAKKSLDDDFIGPRPEILRRFAKLIEQERLLVFGGNTDFDKIGLARFFASWAQWQLRKGKALNLPVLEWQRSGEARNIDLEFRRAKQQNIYLLTQVSPANIGFDLSRIKQAAVAKKHYVILTTDIPFFKWKIADKKPDFWQELSSASLYESKTLEKVIIQEIRKYRKALQVLIKDIELDAETLLAGDLSLRIVAKELRTPDNIFRFVQLLIRESRKLNQLNKGDINFSAEAAIKHLISEVSDSRKILRQWYYYILSSREQLLALGISFFDGLLDDQFFSALEKIFENAWQKRDPSLRSLDYCDLDNLYNFFNLTPVTIGAGFNRIESCLPQQRRLLFSVAWKSHRRQIIAALETIAVLIKDSVANRVLNEELYGSATRREQLRRVLGEALSDIGWIFPTAVKNALRQLAEDEDVRVQAVAASAMARWRDPELRSDPNCDRESSLFEILQIWQREERVVKQIERLSGYQDEITGAEQDIVKFEERRRKESQWLGGQKSNVLLGVLAGLRNPLRFKQGFTAFSKAAEKRRLSLVALDEEQSREPQDYIRATVALTVSYAALYDPPNKLDSRLVILLKQLAKDRNRLVSDRFCFYTLPKIIPLHLSQLQRVLYEMLRDSPNHEGLIRGISSGLALAYPNNAVGVKNLLDAWLDNSKSDQLRNDDFQDVTLREKLIAAVVLTYGEIQLYTEKNLLTPQIIFKQLGKILKDERHPFVCSAILQTISRHTIRYSYTIQHFQKIEPFLNSLVMLLTKSERQELVQIFAAIYFDLRNTSESLSTREEIERTIVKWSQNSKKIIPESISIVLLFCFSSILENERKNPKIRQFKLRPKKIGIFQHDCYIGYIVPYSVIFSKIAYYKIVKRSDFSEWMDIISTNYVITREVLRFNLYNSVNLNFVLNKLQSTRDERLMILSNLLRTSLWWTKNRVIILILILFLFAFAIYPRVISISVAVAIIATLSSLIGIVISWIGQIIFVLIFVVAPWVLMAFIALPILVRLFRVFVSRLRRVS